ncbi:MAG: Re/Si-specific NAD(P)(+) transhydrogenase subunit alpha, partial [Rickettsiales bacterium]|nr:Re/Si-specific NAD(P)(+) transhydrogenase subunit alpha [Rickettsiales bacterium]
EKRVALTPDLVEKYIKLGFEIFVEKDAGLGSSISNKSFEESGAKIVDDINKLLSEIDIMISVQRIDNIDFSKAKEGMSFVSMLNPYFQKVELEKIAKEGICLFAMELLPRITRAQSMDVLSSQSNLSGYVSVLEAAYELPKAIPMMMTAAGTVTAAKFMILGAGVAGLQAIATAKRLGAVVCAFDVRAAAKEQVESLGGKFIEVESDEKNDGVYAQEMSEEYKAKQQALLTETIKKQDVVIATALIPGKKAPTLITKEMVALMRPGSVIVDLAAVNGGNCELTKVGEITDVNGVKIIGHKNFPSIVSNDSSKLYAKNVFNFIELLRDKESNDVNIDLEDEIIKATLISQDRKIVNDLLNSSK